MDEGTSRAFSMRACISLFALALLVMAATVSAPRASAQTVEGRVSIVPSFSSVPVEDEFTVFILLEDLEHYGTLVYDDDRDTVPDREVESIGLAAFEFTIAYDQAVLEVTGVEPGPDLDRTGRSFQCLLPREEPGSLKFGCLSAGSDPPGLQGSLTLASLTLLPVGTGSSPLLLETELAGPLGADTVPVTVSGGVVRVTGSPAKPAATGLAGGATSTPSAGPGTTLLRTPSSSVPTLAPIVSAGPETDEEAEPLATAGAPTRTPAIGKDGDATNLLVRDRKDIEAENSQPAAEGEGSSSSIALWLAVTLGALTAVGAMGLAAVLLRRRKQDGGA